MSLFQLHIKRSKTLPFNMSPKCNFPGALLKVHFKDSYTITSVRISNFGVAGNLRESVAELMEDLLKLVFTCFKIVQERKVSMVTITCYCITVKMLFSYYRQLICFIFSFFN
uniref:Uncharacterized protein n=1 Tax=Pyxicephalus adspersus TaxID=30357 RepID=A0AAV3A5V6_PYXAD|nr:TPA: hypothetical protein GDO54_012256 [Pyxicephalus adspersus]